MRIDPRSRSGTERPSRPTRPPGRDFRPGQDRGPARGPCRSIARRGSGEVCTGTELQTGLPRARPGRRTIGRDARQEVQSGVRTGRRVQAQAVASAARPAWKKQSGGERGTFPRSTAPRREPPVPPEKFQEKKPSRLQIEAVEPERPGTPRIDSFRPGPGRARPAGPSSPRPSAGRPRFDRGASERPRPERPRFDRPKFDGPRPERPGSDRAGSDRGGRSRFERPGGPGRASSGPRGSSRPPRSGGLARPFTTSSGKPRAWWRAAQQQARKDDWPPVQRRLAALDGRRCRSASGRQDRLEAQAQLWRRGKAGFRRPFQAVVWFKAGWSRQVRLQRKDRRLRRKADRSEAGRKAPRRQKTELANKLSRSQREWNAIFRRA